MNKLSAISTSRLVGVKQAAGPFGFMSVDTRKKILPYVLPMFLGGLGAWHGSRFPYVDEGNKPWGTVGLGAAGATLGAVLSGAGPFGASKGSLKINDRNEDLSGELEAEMAAFKAEAKAKGLKGEEFNIAEAEFQKALSDKYNKLLEVH